MAQQCELTGKKPQYGHNVSHANNKTKTRWHLNLQTKKYFIAPLKKSLSLRLTTRAIRTIDKHGDVAVAILKAKTENLSDRLQKIQRQLKKV